MQLKDLPIGSRVKYGRHQINSEEPQEIIWQVAAVEHGGYPTNSVTLVPEELIDIRGFDAKEPSNSNNDRKN